MTVLIAAVLALLALVGMVGMLVYALLGVPVDTDRKATP